MSRFRFRLERVLGVRRIEEEVARATWLEAERPATAAEAQANALHAAIQRSRAELAALQSSSRLGPADVLLKHALVDRLREQWVQKTIAASRLRREAERLRLEMTSRRVRVRGLETLESRAKESWRLDAEVRANAEIDERAGKLRAMTLSKVIKERNEERTREGAGNS